MREVDVDSWEKFEEEISKLREAPRHGNEPLLFRGHSNSEFRLTTTLERAGLSDITFSRYYYLISAVKPAVETITDIDWEVPSWTFDLASEFDDFETFSGKVEGSILRRFPSGAVYRYMMYLRHHGFPSPLLDWSYSPYVAAFFAFQNPGEGVEKRSIYAFCKADWPLQSSSNYRPLIRRIGPYQRSHVRHFQQQSDYTICGRFDSRWFYHSHEDALSKAEPHQDLVTKFNLPSALRPSVLKRLDELNLNAFSLFGNEESLLESVWNREIAFQPNRFSGHDTFDGKMANPEEPPIK
jgi:hypothetical protein